MSASPPPLQPRSPDAIVEDLAGKLGVPLDGTDAMGEGLLRVFGRYVELVTERLNRVPEKHRFAFLGLLGSRPVPPTPARVPLTFVPVRQLAQREAAGSAGGEPVRAVVPAGTLVAAAEPGPDGAAIVFETDRSLELTSLVLRRVVARDATTDRVADHAGLADGGAASVRPFVDGLRPARHACSFLLPPMLVGPLTSVTIHCDGDASRAPGRAVEWWIGAGADPAAVVRSTPQADTTAGLTTTGSVTFSSLPPWPTGTIAGIDGHWLCCSVMPRTAPSKTADAAVPSAAITRLAMSGVVTVERQPPQGASFNAQALDVSTGFYALGPMPRYGDAFYLRASLFAEAGAAIVVRIAMAGSPPATPPPADVPSVIAWEIPVDGRWVAVAGKDTTLGLMQSGAVTFIVPAGATPMAVNRVDGGWIRARYVGAPWTGPATSEPLLIDGKPRPATLPFAPVIERVTIDASKTFAPVPLSFVVTDDDFETAVVPLTATSRFDPLAPPTFAGGGLYLGFEGAPASIDGREVALQVVVGDAMVPIVSDDDARRAAQPLRGAMRDGDRWTPLTVVDASRGLTRSGALSLRFAGADRVDADVRSRLHWVRLDPAEAPSPKDAPIERMLLNTVDATNAVTVRNELLGSSDQHPHQRFACMRVPVTGDVALEVREPVAPTPRTSAARQADRRDDATAWVRWTQVDDFASSGRDDRHFVVDPTGGSVSFGDGVRGRIPPAGPNNVRLHRYRAGGGAAGNVAAGTVSQLRSTVAYVTGVTNVVAATGGSDAETAEHDVARGSAWLRHRDRAVGREDFEDLATAVDGIARARCLPLRSLSHDPTGVRVEAGWVSVVVLPWSVDDAPRPTSTQLQVVHDLLAARRHPGVQIAVAGPEYVPVDVTADVVCDRGEDADAVGERCRVRLQRFLHPLTGGNAGRGWAFAEQPTALMLQLALQHVDGVDQVRRLTMVHREPRRDALAGDHFLVCSGAHRITCADRTLAPLAWSP